MNMNTITIPEICELLGVTKPAISQWRSRYLDFPKPIPTPETTLLFDRKEIIQWAISTGRLQLEWENLNPAITDPTVKTETTIKYDLNLQLSDWKNQLEEQDSILIIGEGFYFGELAENLYDKILDNVEQQLKINPDLAYKPLTGVDVMYVTDLSAGDWVIQTTPEDKSLLDSLLADSGIGESFDI